VHVLRKDFVDAVFELAEKLGQLRMIHGSTGIIHQQILLGNVGDVGGLLVFRKQMIKRLVLARPHAFGNGFPPLIAVAEFRIHVEHDAAERIHPVANDLLGVVYAAKQEFALAERHFSRQIEINPKSSVVYTQLAAARARQGNREGAVAAMRQGLEAMPGDTRLQTGLAGMYTQWGDLDKAAGVFEQGLAESPDNQQLALGLAGIRERQQQYDAAIEIYEQLHEQAPENLIAINNLAALLSDHHKDEKSLARAKELALKLAESKQPALLDTLGWVHYRLGEYDPAAAVLSAVVEQAPDVPVFRYHLGMTYYRQGDTRAAKEILSGAVADEYKYDGVDEARRVYAELAGS